MSHILTPNPIKLPRPSAPPPPASEPLTPQRPAPIPVTTTPNELGVYCVYPNKPSHIPELGASIDSICNTPTLQHPSVSSVTMTSTGDGLSSDLPSDSHNPFAPFENLGTALTMYWHYSGPRVKSGPETTRFTELIQHFPASDVKNFNFTRESKRLDQHLEDTANSL